MGGGCRNQHSSFCLLLQCSPWSLHPINTSMKLPCSFSGQLRTNSEWRYHWVIMKTPCSFIGQLDNGNKQQHITRSLKLHSVGSCTQTATNDRQFHWVIAPHGHQHKPPPSFSGQSHTNSDRRCHWVIAPCGGQHETALLIRQVIWNKQWQSISLGAWTQTATDHRRFHAAWPTTAVATGSTDSRGISRRSSCHVFRTGGVHSISALQRWRTAWTCFPYAAPRASLNLFSQ